MKLIGNYPEQALQTMAITSPSVHPYARGLVPWSPRWQTAKVALRTSIFVFCALTWILFSMTGNGWGAVAVPLIIADIVWELAEFAVLAWFSKSKKRGIHPNAHLVWDLLLWMGYFTVAVMFSGWVVPAWTSGAYQDQQRIYSAMIACASFLFVLWLLHFVLFIRGCVEVHQRRKSKPPGEVLYYVPGQGGAPFHVNYGHEATPMVNMSNTTHATTGDSSERKESFESVEPKVAIFGPHQGANP